ncbi:MAG TPA: class I SAM-dependent methyltransferase [Acidimicrobiales bacterium]|nr:class I SAM-dependent methyltransferase [Acidimicrobiales bacterium]
MSRRDELLALAQDAKGFMPTNEGLALYEVTLEYGRATPGGTWLEVGAWCGKTALYLGNAAEATRSVLYSLDHHHGSEENQAGWEHFDPTLVDPVDGRLNTLPSWQRTVATARLEETVVGLVGLSAVVAHHFAQPLDVLFIDGGHARDVAWTDYEAWTPKVIADGLLIIHDVFADPSDGGQAPYEIYLAALESGRFIERRAEGSLRVLSRV